MPKLVLFEAGGVQFGLDRDCVHRIEPMIDEASQMKGSGFRKSIRMNGRNIDLIDISKALGKNAAAVPSSNAKAIIFKGSPDVAVLANRVRGDLTVQAEQLSELPPVFAGKAHVSFPKVLRRDGQLILVIDVKGLATIDARRPKPQKKSEVTRLVEPVDVKQVCPKTLPSPMGSHSMEALVVHKLKQMIGQHVDRVVAKTMADALDRHQIKLNYC